MPVGVVDLADGADAIHGLQELLEPGPLVRTVRTGTSVVGLDGLLDMRQA